MHMLHPRSRGTSTLFTTTLAVSFLVVALPHLLPCPVDRRQFADSGENGKLRRRRVKRDETNGVSVTDADDAGKPKRECPVPKPAGLVGQIMGFERKERQEPVEVVVRGLNPVDRKRGDGNSSTP